jgi:hypothetical protein
MMGMNYADYVAFDAGVESFAFTLREDWLRGLSVGGAATLTAGDGRRFETRTARLASARAGTPRDGRSAPRGGPAAGAG